MQIQYPTALLNNPNAGYGKPKELKRGSSPLLLQGSQILHQRQGNWFNKANEGLGHFVGALGSHGATAVGHVAGFISETFSKPANIKAEEAAHQRNELFSTAQHLERTKISESALSAPGISREAVNVYVRPQIETQTKLTVKEMKNQAYNVTKSNTKAEQETLIEYGQKQPMADGNPHLNLAEREYQMFMLKVKHGEAQSKDLDKLKQKLDEAERNNVHRIKVEVDYISALHAITEMFSTSNRKLQESIAENFLESHFINRPLSKLGVW
jgi:hypothetical protein